MGPLFLFITTFIWGTAFLAQKYGADALGPFGMTVFRNILGGGFLLVCLWVRKVARSRRKEGVAPESAADCKASIWAGFCCGVPLFAAMASQQIGIKWTTPGISAFLTTNYVIFVPLFVALLTRRFPSRRVLICALAALGGTYLICLTGAAAVEGGSLRIGKGELWTLLCAMLFAVQMVTVDHFSKKSDTLIMSAVQLLTCAVLGTPFLLLPSESAALAAGGLRIAWWPVVYCGIFSSGIGFTLQNVGQARTPAALAAVMLSLESVFGALSGYVVLHDKLSVGQFAGCILVFAAALLVQLHAPKEAPRNQDA